MHEFVSDLRYGLRTLLRNRAFTAVAILALALGIGANTAIFSLVNAIIIRPLPYPDPGSMVLIFEHPPTGGYLNVSPASFLDWQREAKSFSATTALAGGSMVVSNSLDAERVPVLRASSDFFKVFGVAAARGRAYGPDEDRPGAAPVALLSHGMWERRFGSDPAIVGSTVTLDGGKFTVIGVLPANFRCIRPFEVLLPLALDGATAARDNQTLLVVARRTKATSMEQARAEMIRIASHTAEAYPHLKKGWSATVEDLHAYLARGPRNDAPILLGAAGFVLLIACANVASLLLAKAAARRREIAIRASLGAGRFRLVRQLLTESIALAFAGAALGAVLAHWAGRLIQRAIPPELVPPGTDIGVDLTVLAFTAALALVTGIIFGLVPAWRASRVTLHEELKEGARGATGSGARLRSILVAAELALSLVLTAGAGLMVRSLMAAYALRGGFDAANVLTLRMELPETRYGTPAQMLTFQRQSLEALSALPGAEQAAFSTCLPGQQWAMRVPFEIAGTPAGAQQRPTAQLQITSPNYLNTMRIRLKRGRGFTERDTENSQRVALVNEEFARRFLSNEDPVGKHLRTERPGAGEQAGASIVDLEIVGVIDSVGLGSARWFAPAIHVPYAQSPYPAGYVSVRTASDPSRLVQAARAAVRAIDPNVVLSDALTMEQIRARSFAVPNVLVSLFGGFGVLAVLLAVMGVHGLLAWLVAQRTREMGIRTALGANRGDLLRLVLRQAAKLTFIGVGIGSLGALALTRVLRRMLFGVAPGDPFTLIGTAALLFAVALAAAWVPARRAARVDPIVALRQD